MLVSDSKNSKTKICTKFWGKHSKFKLCKNFKYYLGKIFTIYYIIQKFKITVIFFFSQNYADRFLKIFSIGKSAFSFVKRISKL